MRDRRVVDACFSALGVGQGVCGIADDDGPAIDLDDADHSALDLDGLHVPPRQMLNSAITGQWSLNAQAISSSTGAHERSNLVNAAVAKNDSSCHGGRSLLLSCRYVRTCRH